MSNRRRKSIGSKKLLRNRLIRVRRGAVKLGNRLPGHGRWREAWLTATESSVDGKTVYVSADNRIVVDRNAVVDQTTRLRDDLEVHTGAHWRGR